MAPALLPVLASLKKGRFRTRKSAFATQLRAVEPDTLVNMREEARTRLAMHDDAVECIDRHGNLRWRLPASAIVLIAEYTTDEGPLFDDYFLIFWSWEEGSLSRSQVTFYADGRDSLLDDLSVRFKSEMGLGLAGSTVWNSRIVWPPELAGHSYFTFEEAQPANWRQRLSRWLWGPAQSYFASDEVRGFLRRYDPEFQRQP